MKVKVSELKQKGAAYCKKHMQGNECKCDECPLGDKFMCIDNNEQFVVLRDEVESSIFARHFYFMLNELFKEE